MAGETKVADIPAPREFNIILIKEKSGAPIEGTDKIGCSRGNKERLNGKASLLAK
jgi:hypothetical protein